MSRYYSSGYWTSATDCEAGFPLTDTLVEVWQGRYHRAIDSLSNFWLNRSVPNKNAFSGPHCAVAELMAIAERQLGAFIAAITAEMLKTEYGL